MIQHHLQCQKSSFQTMIKMKQRACPSVQRSQLIWRHAVHPWVGIELGVAAPSLARGQEEDGMNGPGSFRGRTLCSWCREDMPRWEAAQAPASLS